MSGGCRALFKKFDYFGIQFNFNYQSREKYCTVIGGVGFLIFLAVAIAYSVITLVPILKRQKMSVIYYSMQIPHTDEINFQKYSNNFALGISACSKLKNYTEFWDYFKINLNYIVLVKENGVSQKTKFPVSIGNCENSDFNGEFASSFDSLGLGSYFCLKDTNYTIKGIYSDPSFQYIEISLMAKDDSEETFQKIKYILGDECDFNMYVMDAAFDLSNYTQPTSQYLVSQYINIKYSELMKRNSFFQLQQFDSYENYLFDTHSRKYMIGVGSNDLYSVQKGEDRLETKIADYNVFAKIYVRADLKRNIIVRRYTKLTEFAANISSILSVVLLVMFVFLTYVNKFYGQEAVMRKVFQFNNPKYNKEKLIQAHLKKIVSKKSLLFGKEEKDDQEELDKNFRLNVLTNGVSERCETNGSTSMKKMSQFSEQSMRQKRLDSEAQMIEENKKKRKTRKKEGGKEKNIQFRFNLIELMFIIICPGCSWRRLKLKRILLKKARKKFFFQLDVLNYLKKMQMLDLLTFTLLEPEENTIIQFLSKPSISLAQRKDIYDKIQRVNNIDSKEVEELYDALKHFSGNQQQTPVQKRLFKLTKKEMGILIKKIVG